MYVVLMSSQQLFQKLFQCCTKRNYLPKLQPFGIIQLRFIVSAEPSFLFLSSPFESQVSCLPDLSGAAPRE